MKEKMQQLSICQPRINAGDYSMEAVLCGINTTFKENIYHIPEPVDGKIINPLLLDIAFVPLVAFDASGYRVGYGKGYFDRFLHRCKPGIIKIGFSFFEASAAIDDINEFDVANFNTPQRIYEF
jgi:5-formyltetrahydrofolate cyclo-ligase